MLRHATQWIVRMAIASLIFDPTSLHAHDPVWPFCEDMPCHPQLFTTLGEYQYYPTTGDTTRHPYLHRGLDILKARGTPVRAIVEGEVDYFQFNPARPKEAGVHLRDVANPAWRWVYGHVDGEEFKERVRLRGGNVLKPEGTVFDQGGHADVGGGV